LRQRWRFAELAALLDPTLREALDAGAIERAQFRDVISLRDRRRLAQAG
jgi:hypothetical protein